MLYHGRLRILLPGCLFLLLVGPGLCSAQDVSAEPDVELVALDEKVQLFLEGVSLGEIQNAYDELLAGSRLMQQDEAIKKLVTQTSELETRFGEYRSFEQIAAKRIGRDVVLLRYLYKCEHFPVVWYFAFYRTPPRGETAAENGNWRIIVVRFDTDLERLAL